MSSERAALCLEIHLQPRATRDRIVGRHGTAIKVQVHAPPVGGAANTALVELLAKTLAIPRRAISIVRGESSRDKLVAIESVDLEACRQRLDAALDARVDKETAGG